MPDKRSSTASAKDSNRIQKADVTLLLNHTVSKIVITEAPLQKGFAHHVLFGGRFMDCLFPTELGMNQWSLSSDDMRKRTRLFPSATTYAENAKEFDLLDREIVFAESKSAALQDMFRNFFQELLTAKSRLVKKSVSQKAESRR